MALLDFIDRIFGQSPGGGPAPEVPIDQHRVAAAALMVEAAMLDGSFDESEKQRIVDLLKQHFDLGELEADLMFQKAEEKAEDSVEWHGFTKLIKEGFDHEGRIRLIEMLWEVAYADGVLHDYEASLIRRITGLLYVTDSESGAARRRVRDRLGL